MSTLYACFLNMLSVGLCLSLCSLVSVSTYLYFFHATPTGPSVNQLLLQFSLCTTVFICVCCCVCSFVRLCIYVSVFLPSCRSMLYIRSTVLVCHLSISRYPLSLSVLLFVSCRPLSLGWAHIYLDSWPAYIILGLSDRSNRPLIHPSSRTTVDVIMKLSSSSFHPAYTNH